MVLLFLMRYFAIQVRTGNEQKYIDLFKSIHSEFDIDLLFLRRRMLETRKGKKLWKLCPLFPGYVFVETDLENTDALKQILLGRALRRTEGFFRFLSPTRSLKELSGNDLKIVQHFLSFGKVADRSKVYFDENQRIVVASGPLKGLEGQIVKVDKRKGRAKIKLDLYKDSFAIDLAFEVIHKS